MPEEITPGQILEALNNKMDRDGMNAMTGCDFVVEYQMPNANNDYTWYRKYASGWVEIGGQTRLMNTGLNVGDQVTVVLPVTMANTNYTITCSFTDSVNDWCDFMARFINRTTTSFLVDCWNRQNGQSKVTWLVSGLAATPSA